MTQTREDTIPLRTWHHPRPLSPQALLSPHHLIYPQPHHHHPPPCCPQHPPTLHTRSPSPWIQYESPVPKATATSPIHPPQATYRAQTLSYRNPRRGCLIPTTTLICRWARLKLQGRPTSIEDFGVVVEKASTVIFWCLFEIHVNLTCVCMQFYAKMKRLNIPNDSTLLE